MPGSAALSILPPKDKGELVNTGIRIPRSLLERLDEIAEDDGYSRNEVIVFFVKWALAEYDREKADSDTGPKKRK